MELDTCIYCGSDSLSFLHKKQPISRDCDIIHCQKCKIKFSALEQRFASGERLADKKIECDCSDEAHALMSAFKLMQNWRWKDAFIILFRYSFPSEYRLEYIIARDVCQAASAMQNSSLNTFNKDNLTLVTPLLLEALKNNLQNLDRYLPQNDEEQRFELLRRLCELLKLLNNVVIYAGDLPISTQDHFAQSAVEGRIAAAGVLCGYLEELQDTVRGSDYLRMAAELWSSCITDGSRVVYTIDRVCLGRICKLGSIRLLSDNDARNLRNINIPDSIMQNIRKRQLSLEDTARAGQSAYTNKETGSTAFPTVLVRELLAKDLFQHNTVFLLLVLVLMTSLIWSVIWVLSTYAPSSCRLFSPFGEDSSLLLVCIQYLKLDYFVPSSQYAEFCKTINHISELAVSLVLAISLNVYYKKKYKTAKEKAAQTYAGILDQDAEDKNISAAVPAAPDRIESPQRQ